jgi:CRP/FNR family cyclic AMP-dependent transcriptional regulator
MISTDALELIHKHKWVQKLPWDLKKLANLAIERHFEPDEVLFHQGDLADRFYVIASGTVGMTLSLSGNIFIAQAIVPWEEIGWDAFIEEGVRSFTATAMTAVRALVFDGPELCAECERDLQFGFLLMKHLLRVVSERLDASRLLLR